MARCPGQDQRFWKPEDIFEADCPECGGLIEFWKDEPKLKCPNCGKLAVNPKLDLGCAEWCQYAKECLGISLSHESNILCNRLIEEMKNIFGKDQKRINHALEVLKYAEQILAEEKADPLVVKAAAILHDIGSHAAEKKHGSAEAKFQEIEGPPVAKKILVKYAIELGLIEHICRIIANHHNPNALNTPEFKIIWDADSLVNLGEKFAQSKPEEEKIKELIDSTFKTEKGRQLAIEKFAE
jgi:putative nucleotidyltransferase with HDIG domain